LEETKGYELLALESYPPTELLDCKPRNSCQTILVTSAGFSAVTLITNPFRVTAWTCLPVQRVVGRSSAHAARIIVSKPDLPVAFRMPTN
jgi:hypothetical protein